MRLEIIQTHNGGSAAYEFGGNGQAIIISNGGGFALPAISVFDSVNGRHALLPFNPGFHVTASDGYKVVVYRLESDFTLEVVFDGNSWVGERPKAIGHSITAAIHMALEKECSTPYYTKHNIKSMMERDVNKWQF